MSEAHNAAKDAAELYSWLRAEALLQAEVVEEAKAALRAEQIFTVADLEVLRQEGGLRDIFTARVTARKVADALGEVYYERVSGVLRDTKRRMREACQLPEAGHTRTIQRNFKIQIRFPHLI